MSARFNICYLTHIPREVLPHTIKHVLSKNHAMLIFPVHPQRFVVEICLGHSSPLKSSISGSSFLLWTRYELLFYHRQESRGRRSHLVSAATQKKQVRSSFNQFWNVEKTNQHKTNHETTDVKFSCEVYFAEWNFVFVCFGSTLLPVYVCFFWLVWWNDALLLTCQEPPCPPMYLLHELINRMSCLISLMPKGREISAACKMLEKKDRIQSFCPLFYIQFQI